jgi:hypothetical protein
MRKTRPEMDGEIEGDDGGAKRKGEERQSAEGANLAERARCAFWGGCCIDDFLTPAVLAASFVGNR